MEPPREGIDLDRCTAVTRIISIDTGIPDMEKFEFLKLMGVEKKKKLIKMMNFEGKGLWPICLPSDRSKFGSNFILLYWNRSRRVS